MLQQTSKSVLFCWLKASKGTSRNAINQSINQSGLFTHCILVITMMVFHRRSGQRRAELGDHSIYSTHVNPLRDLMPGQSLLGGEHSHHHCTTHVLPYSTPTLGHPNIVFISHRLTDPLFGKVKKKKDSRCTKLTSQIVIFNLNSHSFFYNIIMIRFRFL